MLMSFTSPTCVTVTDELVGAEANNGLGAAPGNGGAFEGDAPKRPGIDGRATGALLNATGAGGGVTERGAAATALGAGSATGAGTATGTDTAARATGGGNTGVATGTGRRGNAGAAFGALAIG